MRISPGKLLPRRPPRPELTERMARERVGILALFDKRKTEDVAAGSDGHVLN